MSVRIRLHTIAGKAIELDLSLQSSVRELKEQIAQLWALPPLCQRLLVEGTLLEDSQKIDSYCPNGCITLPITVITTDADAHAYLMDRSPKVRIEAVEAIANISVKKSDKESIIAICGRLEDADEGVRKAAVKAISVMSHQGNEMALSEVGSRLAHANDFVRATAVEALAKISTRGDPRVIEEVRAVLDDEAMVVKMAALLALAEIAQGFVQWF
eukprot:gnl/MRDRNA2_/MRDRNA2_113786_c0_seq1.p1 gnl/MRDRNA2_/MRDRNA2_113786_c0~~gnl/MRDRNA2_/MRDRNA2_113786_c0_seq1.p1  ORF type:complete len:214 (-),score=46.41 gnl/MRDRNA2_/MRDRNA2_113786_c0_seq1:19-660(-)